MPELAPESKPCPHCGITGNVGDHCPSPTCNWDKCRGADGCGAYGNFFEGQHWHEADTASQCFGKVK